jgi:hypothetical protein
VRKEIKRLPRHPVRQLRTFSKIKGITILTLLSLSLCIPPIILADQMYFTEDIWVSEHGCQHGLHHQPNGPFAVFLFCEDALGDYIGVIYADILGAPNAEPFSNRWMLDNRLWQEPIWASDVTSFAWGPSGSRLYVATSNIYGSGGLYELNLKTRKAKQLAPKGKKVDGVGNRGPGYVITELDKEKQVLRYKINEPNSKDGTRSAEISLKSTDK